jgi:hypothetical protein
MAIFWVGTGRFEVPPSGFDFLDPANIGQPVEGGFFAGLISHTADSNPTHALIVAPRATGATGQNYPVNTNLQWKTATTITADTTSEFDGAANTAAMVTAGIANHPAAQFCVNLSIGGFTDWYLPARLELDIAYFHLKPTTQGNNINFGDNPYSVPRRNSKYTTGNPTQTTVTAFQSTQSEAFAVLTHWVSTEVDSSNASQFGFANAGQSNLVKTATNRVRAFRKLAL